MPPLPPNQVGQLPRVLGFTNRSFDRRHFLDGTLKCLYGPGQRANAWPDVGLLGPDFLAGGAGSDNPVKAIPYINPDDWPAAGRLLRVPQVVHLSCFIDDLAGTPGVPKFSGQVERERVVGEFDAVIADLQGLRKDRTWASFQDWANVKGTFPATRGNDCMFLVDQYLHMVGPPPEAAAPTWFGVDYLHVYVGHWVPNYLDGGDPASPWRNFTTFAADQPFGVDSPLYARARLRVTANHDHFARYASRLFAFVSQFEPPGVNELQESAADLAEFGFAYEGDSTAITRSSLMQLIADHFKFDPGTGRDRG